MAGATLYTLNDGGWSSAQQVFAPLTIEDEDGWWKATRYLGDIACDDLGALHAISQDLGDGIGVVYATSRHGQPSNQVLMTTGMWADAPPSALIIDETGRPHLLFVLLSGEEDDMEGLWYVVGPGYPRSL